METREAWLAENRADLAASGVNPIFLRDCVQQWVRLRLASEPERPITEADAGHSGLLLRLFEGKPPFPDPPPKSHSYPWYELVETGHADHVPVFFWNQGTTPIIAQSTDWTVVERLGETEFVVECRTNKERYLLRGTVEVTNADAVTWTLDRIES